MQFTQATKTQIKCRLALAGPSGSGKTWSALEIASHLSDNVAVIDTENHSASRYADVFKFQCLDLATPSIAQYIEAMQTAEKSGFGCLVIDQASHAWEWAKQEVDRITAASRAANSYLSWGKVTPEWQKFINMILHSRMHLICCFRSKTEYVLEDVERGGRVTKVPRKIGMAPITRDGSEYEFDVWCDIDLDHRLVVSKTRCKALDGLSYLKDCKTFSAVLKDWLDSGDAPPATPPATADPPKDKPDQVYQALRVRLRDIGCKNPNEANAVVRYVVGKNDSGVYEFQTLESVQMTPGAPAKVMMKIVEANAIPMTDEAIYHDALEQAGLLQPAA